MIKIIDPKTLNKKYGGDWEYPFDTSKINDPGDNYLCCSVDYYPDGIWKTQISYYPDYNNFYIFEQDFSSYQQGIQINEDRVFELLRFKNFT